MNLESLEQFCQNKGIEIARILLKKYDSADFEVSAREIEKEIYEVATSYSRILFFEAKEFLQESVRDEARTYLAPRFEKKEIQKMKHTDLVAHWIKSEAIRLLEGHNIFI